MIWKFWGNLECYLIILKFDKIFYWFEKFVNIFFILFLYIFKKNFLILDENFKVLNIFWDKDVKRFKWVIYLYCIFKFSCRFEVFGLRKYLGEWYGS